MIKNIIIIIIIIIYYYFINNQRYNKFIFKLLINYRFIFKNHTLFIISKYFSKSILLFDNFNMYMLMLNRKYNMKDTLNNICYKIINNIYIYNN